MPIQFFCPRWGSEELSWGTFCQKVSDAGYNGVEYAIANNVTEKELDEIWNTVEQNNLKLIAQFFESGDADFSKHHDLYCAWLEKISNYPCLKIDSQTGRDFYSFEQNLLLVNEAFQFTNQTGIQVVHETHRNKCLFAAHTSKEYLEKIPELKLTLDASHWVCVAESFLEDQSEAMQLAIERTEHLHARVGYPEGPQIPDPRVPEWQHALNAHLSWWDRVVERKKKENTVMTITPEFGPNPYMVHDPVSGQPIADQWAVNVFMMNLLKQRYR
ncbi:sugar phosphate isomerase/epimerase [Chitinophagaceae bacterium 26-R-25]|nr:sugar phosphate isomerase/epimerase [Chitinophagaceae bacterium 26-R-25]